MSKMAVAQGLSELTAGYTQADHGMREVAQPQELVLTTYWALWRRLESSGARHCLWPLTGQGPVVSQNTCSWDPTCPSVKLSPGGFCALARVMSTWIL
jgi:hypothetical protein